MNQSIGVDLERQRQVVTALRTVLPESCVLFREEDTRPYECDGLTLYRQVPMAVALPDRESQVAQVLKLCHAMQVPVVPRLSPVCAISPSPRRRPRIACTTRPTHRVRLPARSVAMSPRTPAACTA